MRNSKNNLGERVLNAALKLLRGGVSVIPVGSNKVPLILWKDYIERLATPEEVRKWWADYPDANVGIVTGLISDLLVIDVDDPKALDELQGYLQDDFDEPLNIPFAKTPRGTHLYFRYEPGVGNRTGIMPGVDVRGQGGYVVAPPSMGGKYKWGFPISRAGFINQVPIPKGLLQVISGDSQDSQPVTSVTNSLNVSSVAHEGQRDDTLFHAALTMARGGATEEEVIAAVLALAGACDPPFPARDAMLKVKSAFERLKGVTAHDIRDWISIASGYFTAGDIAKDLKSVGTGNIRTVLSRLKSEGVVEPVGGRDGTYRLTTPPPAFVDLVGAKEVSEVPLKWPLQVEELVKVTPKSLVVVAGDTNSGKSCFAINFCDLNLDRHPIYYFSTEISAARFRSRLSHLDRKIEDWGKIKFTDQIQGDFHAHICPEAINIIDYIAPDAEALWRIGLTVDKVFEALTTGIAIIFIQKKGGSDLGYGGAFTSYRAELYLTLSTGESGEGTLKIIKGKNWRSERNNPYGQKRDYQITYGIQMSKSFRRPEWYTGSGDSEKDY